MSAIDYREALTNATTIDDVQALLAPDALAALAAYDDPELAFDLARCRRIHGCASIVQVLRGALKQVRTSAPPPLHEAEVRGPTLTQWLRDEGCPWTDGECVVPFGWHVAEGVSRVIERNERRVLQPVCPSPIAVVGRAVDEESGRVCLDVAWRYQGRWTRRTVDRTAAMSRDGVLALAGEGAPVDQSTATLVAQWLAACDHDLEVSASRALARLGWLPDGSGFAWGSTALGAPVALLPPGQGEREEAERYRTGGTVEGWRAGVWDRCAGYPAEVVLLASLAAPLLHVVGSTGFTLDIGGPRGSGKTTGQHGAASCWGSGIVVPWPRTWAGMRSTVEFRADLPTILDDTKHASGWNLVRDLLYQVAGERSQVLGSQGGGTRAGRLVRTIVISTGESPIAEHLQDAQGAAYRILTLGARPFPAGARKLVMGVEQAAREHFGHVGPMLVRYLVDRRDQWGALRERWRTLAEGIAERHPSDDAGRLAPRLALLALASEVAELALGLRSSGDALRSFERHALGGVVERDAPAEALRFVLSYLASRPTQVVGYVEDRHLTPPFLAQRDDQGPLLLLVSELPRILDAGGYDAAEIRRQWHERGWLERTEPGRTDCRAYVRGQRARVVEIAVSALQGVVP